MKKILFSIITTLLITVLMIEVSQDAVFAWIKERSSPVNVLEELDPEIINFSYHSNMIEVSKDEKEYVEEKFLDAGYKPLEIDTVEEATYSVDVLIKLGTMVTMHETDTSVRVSWGDFEKDAIKLLFPNDVTDSGEVVMAQIGVERGEIQDNPMIGMCYVYKLSDGSAVVIDGGFPNEKSADNLYQTLDKLGVARDEDNKMRIAAWIFSHGHVDHIGTFYNFSIKYHVAANVESIFYSFPVGTVTTNECDVDSFIKLATTYYPDAVHVEPRTGLKYYFDNLTVDILYAPEMIYKADETLEYFNDTSLIFTVECNGAKVLHFGDSGEQAAMITWNNYSENAFLSDAVQITHHGLNTGSLSHDWEYIGYIYEATEAEIGLLPLGTRNENQEINGRYNLISTWAAAGYQISFVTDNDDTHGLTELTQEYYDIFVQSVQDGTSKFKTFFGYNGINTVVNENGMTTYIASSETEDMISIFLLSQYGIDLLLNTELGLWLNK